MQKVEPVNLTGKMADKVDLAKTDLAKTRLSDVKLAQLPRWFATGNYTPRGVFNAFWRGVDRYNAKYTNVIKGNITPVAHVLVTTLVVSYIWRYQQEKHHRSRKHHW